MDVFFQRNPIDPRRGTGFHKVFQDDPFVGEVWMRFKAVRFLAEPSSLFVESFEADQLCEREFSKIVEMA